MEEQSGLSELSVISWVSAFQGCPLKGVPLYSFVSGGSFCGGEPGNESNGFQQASLD